MMVNQVDDDGILKQLLSESKDADIEIKQIEHELLRLNGNLKLSQVESKKVRWHELNKLRKSLGRKIERRRDKLEEMLRRQSEEKRRGSRYR